MAPERPPDVTALLAELEALRLRCADLERRVEEAHGQGEDQYRAVFDASGDSILIVDRANGQVLDANRAAIELYGYSLDELRHMRTMDLSTEPDATARAIKESLFRVPSRDHRKKDGTVFPVEITNRAAVVGGRSVVIGIIRDISERKRLDEALRFTQFTIDHSGDGVVWIDPTTVRLIYANDAACHMLGYSREEMLSLRLFDIDPGLTASRYPDIWREIRKRGSLVFEVQHRTKDGREVPVEVSANLIEFGGREYDVAFWRDISERKRADEQRRHLEAQVQHAQKLESLGVLAGGIAHDFNNLLTGILGHADLVHAVLDPGSRPGRSITEIQRAARRAADLCQQLLAYSGRGRFVVQALDIREVVEEMAHLLAISVSKKASLKTSFAPQLPLVEADATQMRQVVMNLITNASEAIGDRGGTISIATGAVPCDRACLDDTWLNEELPEGIYVFIDVSDDGSGMDEETITKVFDPFFTTKFTGRGLGLAAVLGIVRGHRGGIKVSSELGKGTTFRVLLPALDQAMAPPQRQAVHESEWRGSGVILLVDDEEVVRIAGQDILTWLGFEALTASDGREAIEVFMAHHGEVAGIILDLSMPQLDGIETLQELRRLDAQVPVVLSSGYGEQDVAQRLAGQAIAGFLQKPFDVDACRTILQRIFESRLS